ncbi:baseplate J/gp47 family protein [Paenibacillus sp. YN15]|uniref:baseplate J/gp47 family protein n=1 Tax=Paenibacillus sp. YN15 TaxID=1742774 RepID=UPI000DCCFA00|nr:baseplate J/gp47 family protein [Paenibacillus sp. YN15]RAU93214.1 baseplate j family protein [Paenibacillus sp. YN15]
MFEQETQEKLLKAMLGRMEPGIAKLEGSFSYDVSSALSVELAIAYAQLERVLRLGFAATSSGVYLDRRADEHGVTRRSAAKANGEVVVTGSAGAAVPKGTVFATGAGIRYAAAVGVVLPAEGRAVVKVEAEKAGASGNAASGTITVIPVSVSGVSAVNNDAPVTGGADAESDASLLERLLQRVRNQATSGNAAHYKLWAMEVEGIGDARVFPLWNGPGTVKVVVLNQAKRAPAAEQIDAVKAHIEASRPVGAMVTVEASQETAMNVSVQVTLSSGYPLEKVRTAIQAGIQSYLQNLAFKDPVVRYTRIANIILDTEGVEDYTALTVNGGTANISIADGAVAVPGQLAIQRAGE